MAAATRVKRAADTKTTRKAKRRKMKQQARKRADQCIWCCDPRTTFPAVSESCSNAHEPDICSPCWHWHLATIAIANESGDVKCAQCPAIITYRDLERIMSKPDLKHYNFRLRRANAMKNGERECVGFYQDQEGKQVSCQSFTAYDYQRDGRVFQCKDCGDRQCVDCEVREHIGETCVVFQARLAVAHRHEEDESKRVLTYGWTPSEHPTEIVDGQETVCSQKQRRAPKRCPCCGVWIQNLGCFKLRCSACGNLFCQKCNVSYLGENSISTNGNKAHGCDCPRRFWGTEDKRYRDPDGKRDIERAMEEAAEAAREECLGNPEDTEGIFVR